MKNVLIAMMKHETNNFLPVRTMAKDFKILKDEEIFNVSLNRFSGPKGIINALSKNKDINIVPSVFANAIPGGSVTHSFFDYIREKIINDIKKNGKIDGVVLDLHGSMITDESYDPEGDLVASIRECVGEIPLTASLDMHATITEKMLRNIDSISGYHTAPHIDVYETGERAANILISILEGKKIYMASSEIPFLVAGEKSETDAFPMKELIDKLKTYIKMREVIDCSYFLGFPWADNTNNGANIIVISKDRVSAETKANELAGELWKYRDDFDFSTAALPAHDAVREAYLLDENRVFISDSCDNPTAGSAGDNTNLLRNIFDYRRKNNISDQVSFSAIVDEIALNKCKESGENSCLEIELGGKIDSKFSSPLKISGKVEKIIVNYDENLDMVLFKSENVNIFISSKRFAAAGDFEIFKHFNIDINKQKIVVIKCGYLSQEFKDISSHSIFALTKGYSNQNLSEMDYRIMKKNVYPVRKIDNFIPEAKIYKKASDF